MQMHDIVIGDCNADTSLYHVPMKINILTQKKGEREVRTGFSHPRTGGTTSNNNNNNSPEISII